MIKKSFEFYEDESTFLDEIVDTSEEPVESEEESNEE